MINKEKEQVESNLQIEKVIQEYIEFKQICVNRRMFNINEIIKLFEVYITSKK